MVAAFTKMLSFLVQLYEAGNGMIGPRHGYLTRLSYLTIARLRFAVALWMYSCVQGKLHVAPCWDLTKYLFANVKVVAQTMILTNDLHKDFECKELCRCYYAEQ